ncbi:MAG: hypothetical protein AAF203_07475, partial [Pseudomonadota bacterium]
MKLKTLIAALSIFTAAAFMTACSDDNNNTNPVAEKPDAKPSVGPAGGVSAEDAEAVDYAVRLQALADLQFSSERCDDDAFAKVNSGLLKSNLEKLIDMSKEINSTNVVENDVNKGAISNGATTNLKSVKNSDCAIRMAKTYAQKAQQSFIPQIDGAVETQEDMDKRRAYTKNFVTIVEAGIERHAKLVDMMLAGDEVRAEFAKSASAIETLGPKIPGLIEGTRELMSQVEAAHGCAWDTDSKSIECKNEAGQQALKILPLFRKAVD